MDYNSYFSEIKSSYHRSTWEINALEWNADDRYMVTVTKDNGRWVVFGEDHEPSDVAALMDCPLSFKTKQEAIAIAQEFGKDFADTWEENKETLQETSTMDYTKAEAIAAFLIEQKGSVLSSWLGKLSKKDQLNLFGRYFGKGTIAINGENETITHIVKVAFGQDVSWTAQVKFDGTIVFINS